MAPSETLHPTVQACCSRAFCDATFEASQRRLNTVNRLLDHIHGNEHTGPMEGCKKCLVLLRGSADGD